MASAVAGLATGMGIGVGYGVLSEYARLGLLWAKWKGLGKPRAYSKIAEVMQSILSAEKDEVTGLSSKGAVDTIVEFIDKTLDLAWMVDESIATQMFVQMIQQSIAYAIHSSHAGSIGTIGNVYSGSTYLTPTNAPTIAEKNFNIDRSLRAFLSAEVGQNVPTLAFSLLRGGHMAIDDSYRRMLRQMDTFLDEWNDLALSYYRHFHSMARQRLANALEMKEDATNRAYGLLEQVANEHLARISEQLDTLEGAKAWFDATLLSEDELKDISIRINLERSASESNYDEYKATIIEAIDLTVANWGTYINIAVGDLTLNEYYYSLLIHSIFDVVFDNVTAFVDALLYDMEIAVEDVCAYRNMPKAIEFIKFAPPPVPPPPPIIQHGIRELVGIAHGKAIDEPLPATEIVLTAFGKATSESFTRTEAVVIVNE